ncbi:glycosyl transferases group 1 family protein [Synechococcus sp. A15-127]|uniref:hypothetical protein n=1 Tax=Synechococcus sp. A15-127 TaxID=1050624 RepID=UPI0016453E1A|nr:hypothetical protein [Synechococcus sp. A15-127]QNI95407.1 glycosyl transferases group 1 family protein [Synechococcus sp. A15-127]
MEHVKQIGLHNARIGYVPSSNSLMSPGDKRRFPYYASKRNIKFEIANASKEYDIVVLTQSADITFWSKHCSPSTRIVYDLIDSYLAIPKTNLKGWLRGPAKYISGQNKYLRFNYWNSIEDMCVRSDAVICSTSEQSTDISKFCSNSHVILDSHMDVARKVKTNYISSRPFRLVWEGLPQNAVTLKILKPVLDCLSKQFPIELHIITDPTYKKYLGKFWHVNTYQAVQSITPNIYFHEWIQSNCADIICSCDLAVIPLDLSDSFAAGKPENKLLLLWRMGMPVVTSPSPAYVRAMAAANLNYTAKDEADWLSILSKLICDQDLRQQAGISGKAYVDREFSESKQLSRWDSVFQSLGFHVSNKMNTL